MTAPMDSAPRIPARVVETDYYGPNSLSALVYDAVETALRPADREIAFYRRHADACRTPVLEVGVGSGRIAWPLVDSGRRVVGIDRSEAMLAVAEAGRAARPPEAAARLRLVRADMRDFALDGGFDLAIIPHLSFNHLMTTDDQRRFLGRLRAHLAPGGRAVIDAHQPSFAFMTDDGAFQAARRRLSIRLAGAPLRVEWMVEDRAADLAAQTLRVDVRYAVIDDADRVLRDQREILRLRWTLPEEMRALLAGEGFRVLDEWGGFDEKPAPDGPGDRLWLVAP